MYKASGQIEVKLEIEPKERKRSEQDFADLTLSSSEVNEEWVRKKVAEFVESELRAY